MSKFDFLCIFFMLFIFALIGAKHSKAQKRIDIYKSKAKWINKNLVIWEIEKLKQNSLRYFLYEGDVSYENNILKGEKTEVALKSYENNILKIDVSPVVDRIEDILKHHIVLAITDKKENLINATGVSSAEIIDELYTYEGNDLGVVFKNNVPELRLWAPTAQSVKLHLFTDSKSSKPIEIIDMEKLDKGVWFTKGNFSWEDQYYLYEVEVFIPSEKKIVKSLVTDPYSISLSINSERSQILNLNNNYIKPDGWDSLKKPNLKSFLDIVIYELHIRDFSINDKTVPKDYRGTYLAFTVENSDGMKHLKNLSNAGLTHIHLLPSFDIATIEENRNLQLVPNISEDWETDSEKQQAEVSKVKDSDGFNWGYDPFHYNTPEGSYAFNPDGSHRIWEFRKMIKALNDKGLRVILDVVYNHTHSSGFNNKSILDKIVPNYYYRHDKEGNVLNTTCCPDTASERNMMEKLIIDSLLMWAKCYKIDGFRFDLMGHHTVQNLKNIRESLDKLTIEKDGVDGKKIYLYGEGWQFGSLNDKLPNEAFHQKNAYGQGIGTFNDRIRDSLRGGNYEHSTKSDQGFINGLYYDYNNDPANKETPKEIEKQREILLNYTDNIRIGMTGNLKNFEFINSKGEKVKGKDIFYRGSAGAGYTKDPVECINYISAHDNYTLWDQITAKAPFNNIERIPNTATVEEKQRMQLLGISIIMLGQGIPFFHAGIDMLRSKSGDGDSYNSGDWFNKLDFTYQCNNWGVGLPPEWKNKYEWDFWKPRLQDKTMIPSHEIIYNTVKYFLMMLKVRKSSKLFRLETSKDIIERVKFLNAELGKNQTPGLIVMLISDENKDVILDKKRKNLICLFNATKEFIDFKYAPLDKYNLKIHEELDLNIDANLKNAKFENGLFRIPPRTTVVYYTPR